MKTIDQFLFHDLCKSFRKCEVGFCIDDVQPYNKALASARMRCYDLLGWLEKQGIHAELYKPFKKYKVVFFMKTRSDKAVKRAKKLCSKGVALIMDPYCEFIADESMADNWERKNVLELTKQMDIINACGQVQYDMFRKYHDKVNIIGDTVHEDFFKVKKDHINQKQPIQSKDSVRKISRGESGSNPISLIYCGYHKKTKDTLCIKNVILKLQAKYNCELILLTDKDPEIKEFPYRFVKYDQRNIAELFTMGDIMIAPRPMEGIETLSHSNTKIAYPMAVGLPVVASPVPSYLDSPAILCSNEEEWYQELEHLIIDPKCRKELGEKGREFIWENYSVPKIGERYRKMIEEVQKR